MSRYRLTRNVLSREILENTTQTEEDDKRQPPRPAMSKQSQAAV